MVIEKGRDWGGRGVVVASTPVVDSDAALADLFSVDRSSHGDLALSGPDVVALLPHSGATKDPRAASGGLARTVGARGTQDAILGQERAILPIDLGVATFDPGSDDQREVVIAASLVICSRLWSGPIQGAMNAAFLGDWNVAPGGHPNDGRFDVIEAQLTLSDRFKARTRLPSGSHIPHPNISIRRLKAAEFVVGRSASVWIDGRPYGRADKVELAVFPDAVSLAI